MELSIGASFVALTAAAPGLVLLFNRLTPAAVYEEDVGYRYFNTLRILYGREHPFIPQGQAVGLIHILIQQCLTFAGLPINQLEPRVDVFSYAAMLLPALADGLAFLWVARALRGAGIRILLAVSLVLALYAADGGYMWASAPDYQSWIPVLALVATGWFVRIRQRPVDAGIRWAEVLAVGLFGGACLSVKPTLAVLPLAVGVYIATHDRRFRVVAAGLISAGLAGITWGVVVFIYLLGHKDSWFSYWPTLLDYIRSDGGATPTNEFALLLAHPLSLGDVALIIPLAPLCLIIAGLVSRKHRLNWWSLALVACAPLVIYRERPYSPTLFESQVVSWSLVWPVAAAVPWRSFARRTAELSRALAAAAAVVSSGALLLVAGSALKNELAWLDSLRVSSTAYQSAAGQLNAAINRSGGKTAYLYGDNTYRMQSLDSALCKGGSDMYSLSSGLSPFMKTVFPDRGCGIGHVPVNFGRFHNLAFVRRSDESLPQALQRVQTTFTASTYGFTCHDQAQAPYGVLVLCSPDPTVAPFSAATFQNGMQVVGWRPPQSLDVRAGSTLRLTLLWRTSMPLQLEYSAFLRLRSGTSIIQPGDDHDPGRATHHYTPAWRPGDAVPDEWVLPVPKDAKPGDYQLEVGIYDYADVADPVHTSDGAGAGSLAVIHLSPGGSS